MSDVELKVFNNEINAMKVMIRNNEERPSIYEDDITKPERKTAKNLCPWFCEIWNCNTNEHNHHDLC